MPDSRKVFEKLKQLCSAVDDSVMPFCESAAVVLGEKLRADADASDIRLLTAAAAVAYCNYVLFNNIPEGEISYFKAGDITVRKGSSSQSDAVIRFRDTALSEAAPLFCDDDFVFRVV